MSSRSRQAALSNVEALILAQAAWEHGATSWPTIAKILAKHPLINRPKSFFTAQSSHLMYENLLKEAGIARTEQSDAAHSAENKALAEKFYRARAEELRGLILAEENNFKSILSEIETIRSGNFDAEITARINGVPLAPPKTGHEGNVSQPTVDEVFGGSDLTGVTVTPASSQSRKEALPISETPQEQTSSFEEPSANVSPPSNGDHTEVPTAEDAGESHKDQPVGAAKPGASDQPATPEAAPEVRREEDHNLPADDQDEKREEEEEEEEDAVEKEVVSETPRTNDDALREEEEEEEAEKEVSQKEAAAGEPPEQGIESSEATKEPALPPREEASESPAVPELEVEDGESSGEEPLHVSRRSTRRGRSTFSPALPLQNTRKSRRQRAESPPKEEPEPDQMDDDDTQGGTPNVEMDDASPAPLDTGARRREGKRKASVADSTADSPRERKRARDDSEPVDEDEPGPTLRGGRRVATRSEEQVALKRFQNVIGMVHLQISQHRNGNIFHNPIKLSEAPDYREIVKRPIDLKTIKMKVKDGSITNSLEYQRDIFLMFANAMMYNRPGSEVHTMAEEMMTESERQILNFRNTEGIVRSRS